MCLDEKTGSFLEYVDNEWRQTDSDQQSNLRLKWDNAPSSSTQQSSVAYDPYHCEVNGVKLAWNDAVQHWLPEVELNDDFMAQYQSNYGVDYDYSSMPVPEPNLPKEEPKKLTKAERRAKKREYERQQAIKNKGWVEIEDDKNTNVYVDGLPKEITDEEFAVTFFKNTKCHC